MYVENVVAADILTNVLGAYSSGGWTISFYISFLKEEDSVPKSITIIAKFCHLITIGQTGKFTFWLLSSHTKCLAFMRKFNQKAERNKRKKYQNYEGRMQNIETDLSHGIRLKHFEEESLR